MSTIRTPTREQRVATALRAAELPPLSTTDRLALRLGVGLILWGQRHAERAERAEHSRRSGAEERAAHDRDTTFEHRTHAGPTW